MSPAPTRKEAAANPKEPPKPLMTREPLAQGREKKPASPTRKKRRAAPPTKPPYTFNPKHSHVPCGLQDPPVSPSTPIFARPSEPFTSSYDEQHMDPYADRDVHEPFHDRHDAPRQHRVFSEHTSTEPPGVFPSTPCTENDMSSAPEMHDSPVSYTSSSSPAPSDQSPAEFASQVEYMHQVPPLPLSVYPYAHLPVPVVHQHYTYVDGIPDRPAQSFPLPHYDPPYTRAAPHVPGNNGYHHYSNTTHRF